VQLTEERSSFMEFLTSACAIVGCATSLPARAAHACQLTSAQGQCCWMTMLLHCRGVFTVSGIVDALFYHGHQVIKKKMDLGKLH